MSTVCDDGGGDAKSGDPTTEEGLGHCFSCDRSEGNGFGPACESIDIGEEVGETASGPTRLIWMTASGSGPTRSIWMTSKRALGFGNDVRGADVCL